jgi:hypothetical protein
LTLVKYRSGSSTAAPVAGARVSYHSDNGTKAEDWSGCHSTRRTYRGEHRQAAERAAADIEGHSEAAKFSQPG